MNSIVASFAGTQHARFADDDAHGRRSAANGPRDMNDLDFRRQDGARRRQRQRHRQRDRAGLSRTWRHAHVWGTRAGAGDDSADEGSDLRSLHYCQVNPADPAAIEAVPPGFDSLDVLVPCQGTVRDPRSPRCPASPPWSG
jgi:hypothetical protein